MIYDDQSQSRENDSSGGLLNHNLSFPQMPTQHNAPAIGETKQNNNNPFTPAEKGGNSPAESPNLPSSKGKGDAFGSSLANKGPAPYGAGSQAELGKDIAVEGAKAGAKEGVKASGEVAAGAATGGAGTVIMKAADTATIAIKKAHETVTYQSSSNQGIGCFAICLSILAIPILLLLAIFMLLMPSSVTNYFSGSFSATKEGYVESKQPEGWFSSLASALAEKFSFFDEPFEEFDGSFYQAAETNKKLVQKAIQKAYEETALLELESIIEAEQYDYGKTMESFKENEPPTTINYAEFITVMCQSEEFERLQFDSKKLKRFLMDNDNLKYLYTMTVTPETEVDELTGIEIIYGKVTLYSYSLQQLYQMFGIDPNQKNAEIYSCTNYELLDYQENLLRFYANGIDLGPNVRSDEGSIVHKNELTGRDDEDVTIRDINNQISEKYVRLDVPYYNQGDYPSIKYGQGSIKSSGCCLVSLVMIGEYYSGHSLSIAHYASPQNKYVTYDKGMGGYYINKYHMLDDLGISFSKQNPYSQLKIMTALQQGIPVMIHFPKGSEFTSSGHYAVITGYDISKNIFLMCDPGSRARTKNGISFAKMATNADVYYLYQK